MKFRLLTIFVSAAVFLAAAPAARGWWLIDRFGGVSEFGPDGQVLGEGSSGDSGGEEIKIEEKRGSGEEFKTEIKPDERKTEIRFFDENRIKTEFRPEEFKTEIRQGETRLKLERKDGEVRMKLKNEMTGEEREVKNEFEKRKPDEPESETEVKIETKREFLRIRERDEKNEVRVGTENGGFVIDRNKIRATTDFPLSVDLSTNTLSVTTPAGEKRVTILPDEAVQNMLSRNVIDRIGGQEVGGLSTRVKMSQKSDGTLIYEVEGEKQELLFGLVPMKFKKTAVVSAETGELLETKATFTDRILEFISF